MRAFNLALLATLSYVAVIGATPPEARAPAEAIDRGQIPGYYYSRSDSWYPTCFELPSDPICVKWCENDSRLPFCVATCHYYSHASFCPPFTCDRDGIVSEDCLPKPKPKPSPGN